MTIRTYADIQTLREQGDLTSAEETLIENCRAGEPTMLGDGEVPDGPSDARTIRADLLRYLITGGCAKCPTSDRGVDLTGAFVNGALDLRFAKARGATALRRCRFKNRIMALQARLEFLNITGSHLRGLNLQGGQIAWGVFLRKIRSEGEVRLSGAKIGGQLSFTGAQFSNSGGKALMAQKMEVEGGLYWRKVADVSGIVDLNRAWVAALIDDAPSWDLGDGLLLNGFRYDNIKGPMTPRMRLKWIAKDKATAGEFRPQPYEQLANVYKSMGHETDRRAVLIEKQHLQRAVERERLSGFWGSVRRPFKWSLDSLSWLVIGYGYRPFRVLWALLILLLIGWGMAYQAWHAGDFAPNSDVILSTPEWQALAEGDVVNPAAEWSAKFGAGRDWETFHSLAYAFDIVVPIVTIGQTEAWAPSTNRGAWGENLWWMRWVLTVLGWIVTAVGAAAITGIIRRE